MSKYSPFKKYLKHLNQDTVSLSFSVIEDLISDKLPESAYIYREWWSNEQKGSHVQAHSWMNVGWLVESVDFENKIVNLINIKSQTPFLDELFNQVKFNRELVYKFFIVFSLFENGLKRSGFLKSGGVAQPDWDDFAESIEEEFNINSSKELEIAVDYLLSDPVQIQIRNGEQLSFVSRRRTDNISKIVWLSRLINGVRNNLFHGGKFRYDWERDNNLIKYSLVVLESWAHLNPLVYQALKESQ